MKKQRIRMIAFTGIFSALSAVLMMLSFSVPLVPSYLKFDFSEFPALIASFAMGPVSGVIVCLVKNLINLPMTTTGGVGELCNFLLGASFVLPAGIAYRLRKNRRAALLSALGGSLAMALFSLPLNWYVTYPMYIRLYFGGNAEAVLSTYQAILPSVDSLFECLVIFNLPFTLAKGLLDTLLTFLIYKRISPLIKGKAR